MLLKEESLLELYFAFVGGIFLFVLVANSMLIYGFHKTSRPFTIVTKLFIYMSICDTIMVSFYLLSYAIFIIGNHIDEVYYAVARTVYYWIEFTNLFLFWTISFLRFLSIYKPMYRFETGIVNKILVIEILVTFFSATLILTLFTILGLSLGNMMRLNREVTLGKQLTMLFTNLSLNMSSVILLRRSTNSKARQATDNVSNNTMVIKQKKKALHTLILITICQALCNIPLACYLLFEAELYSGAKGFFTMTCFHCIQLSYHGFNSLIIISRTKSLRKFYRIQCCKKNHGRSSNIESKEIDLRNIQKTKLTR